MTPKRPRRSRAKKVLRTVVKNDGRYSGFTPEHYVVPSDIAAEFDSIEIVEGSKRTILTGWKR